MIQLVEKIIIKKFPNLTNGINTELLFLKYSTPNSGKNLDDKVIFFVFKINKKNPFLCVKTVRTYLAKNTVIKNFDNLKKLNILTKNSNLFARAVYLHDDGENIFSIETVCPGKKTKFNKKKLKKVVEEYINFQESIKKYSNESIENLEYFAKDLIKKSKLKELDKQKILQFIDQMSFKDIKLPRIIQHGDVTEDNVLLSKNGLCIIDYNFVGLIDIPGFDLFGLFRRYNQSETRKLCYKYLPEYFKRIGAEVDNDNYQLLLFFYYIAELVLRKPHLLKNMSAQLVISDFKKIYF